MDIGPNVFELKIYMRVDLRNFGQSDSKKVCS